MDSANTIERKWKKGKKMRRDEKERGGGGSRGRGRREGKNDEMEG